MKEEKHLVMQKYSDDNEKYKWYVMSARNALKGLYIR